jgi:hypothetical protein
VKKKKKQQQKKKKHFFVVSSTGSFTPGNAPRALSGRTTTATEETEETASPSSAGGFIRKRKSYNSNGALIVRGCPGRC